MTRIQQKGRAPRPGNGMNIELNGFSLDLALLASQHGHWLQLPLVKTDRGLACEHQGLHAALTLERQHDRIGYEIQFTAPFRTRLRFHATLREEQELFHLIPGNIHGDNNAAHVRPGEFPCLTTSRPAERNCAALWEFRAD